MAEGFGRSLVVLFAFVSCFFHLTFCSASTDDLERYNEALRENRVQLTALSKPTTSPIVQAKKPPDAQVLDLYCYENVEQLNLQNIWKSVCFELSLKERQYDIYSGTNESHVFHLYEMEASNWRSFLPISFFSSRHVCFSPLERACVGIYTSRSYKLNLVVEDYDPWLVGLTVCGVLLFLFSCQLCRSTLFYYVTGISVGVLTSILIVFIIVGRLFTKRFSVLAVSLAAGGSLTFWVMQWLWINLQVALEFYQEYIVGYLVFSALLSFAICYYFGPITNERLLDLIKWFLQGVAAVMIYCGIQSTGVAYAVIGLLVVDQIAACCWRHV